MKDAKIWVIAMDFTEMDNNLLKYTSFLSSCWKPSQLHLLHVEKEHEKASYLPSEFEELRHQVTVDSKLKMEHKMETYFGDMRIKCECHIRTGNALDEIIDFVKEKSAGLVISGRKKISNGSGIVSDRLSRNLPCDFLLVPEDSVLRLNTLMVPTDFSGHATLAMQRAIEIRTENKKMEVLAMHIYAVPWGYSKSGKSFEEFADIMKVNAEDEMSKWGKQFASVKPVFKLLEKSAQDEILDIANSYQVDLLVMGSKGQTKMSLALLGSKTMKVIKVNDTIPLLIVKKEGENLDFIDALKRV